MEGAYEEQIKRLKDQHSIAIVELNKEWEEKVAREKERYATAEKESRKRGP